ncbi:MAG TPA: VRR-NUC domain-containing protein [Nitrobacter sp.]|nr:VRR-NUC domain-containing protein [Nitrobacter sp.]
MKPIPTERQVQRAILDMAGICFPGVLIHHSPNGAHLAGEEGARFRQVGALKGDGMKIGWPDLMCVWNHGTAYIEVKRPGSASRITPDQAKIHAELAECGYPVAVVTSPEEAFLFLRGRGAPVKVQWRVVA